MARRYAHHEPAIDREGLSVAALVVVGGVSTAAVLALIWWLG